MDGPAVARGRTGRNGGRRLPQDGEHRIVPARPFALPLVLRTIHRLQQQQHAGSEDGKGARGVACAANSEQLFLAIPRVQRLECRSSVLIIFSPGGSPNRCDPSHSSRPR
eukprot:3436456-Prymnesium_polylepis.1